jgi:uncharacterized membrane protein
MQKTQASIKIQHNLSRSVRVNRMRNIKKTKLVGVGLGLTALIQPGISLANRYISCEDMGYEDCGLGGSGTFFDLGGIAILILLAFLLVKSKQFRKYLLIYVLFCLAGAVTVMWIKTEFGKEGLVLAVIVVGLLYWKFEDKLVNSKRSNDED